MLTVLRHFFLLAVGLFAGTWMPASADETVFSGPQVGEPLGAFTVQGVFDDEAGKEFDFVTQAGKKPIVLIFVHEMNRQSVAMTRILSQYTTGREKQDLETGVIWLADDITEAESTLKRVRHALAPNARTGISVDGREGPGSYGLNRKVTLTILVGKEGKVTGNFALVQPSLQADLPRILASVVEVAGGTVPRLEDLEGMKEMPAARSGNVEAPNMRPLLAPLIRRNATPEEVDKAAVAVEAKADEDVAVRREVGRIANTIIDAGKLANYGTPKAQEYLQKWATAYGRPEQNNGQQNNGQQKPGKQNSGESGEKNEAKSEPTEKSADHSEPGRGRTSGQKEGEASVSEQSSAAEKDVQK